MRLVSAIFIAVAALLLLLLCSCKESTLEPVLYGRIEGSVRAIEDNSALEGASITTLPASTAIVTAKDGSFSIPTVAVGSYAITVTRSGYKRTVVNVSVLENATTTATIMMEKGGGTNTPPNSPTLPSPADNATNQPLSLTLTWRATDPDAGDSLTYDLFLYESSVTNGKKILSRSPDTLARVENLKYGTSYYWQVVVHDTGAVPANGPVWGFLTMAFPEYPIVYASSVAGNYEIYSTNANGDTPIRITTNASRDFWPRYNYRHDRIAFSSESNLEQHIYTMNRDGSSLYKVTSVPIAGYQNPGIGFCWSPDGGWLYYSHYNALYRIDPYGSNRSEIAVAPAGRHFRCVEIAPAGNRLVVEVIGERTNEGELYTMNTDGTGMALFFSNVPGIIQTPVFSIDSRKVMFTRDVSGYDSQDGRQLDAHIVTLALSIADTVDVSKNKPAGTNDLYPRYSPDGAKIIFVNAPNDQPERGELWIMDSNGDNRRRLAANGAVPDWR